MGGCWTCHAIRLWLFKLRGARRVDLGFATSWHLGNTMLLEYDKEY